jgi:hypothetical protein
MGQNTTERDIVEGFLNSVSLKGTFIRTITRASGEFERKAIPNIVTADGLNLRAARGVVDTSSKFGWIGVGTENYTPHINSQSFGESNRKVAALISSSAELIVAIATWGGAADSVTSDQMEMAGIANHETAGSGVMLNIANGVSTVLADSDFLHLEVQVRVGSHNV